MSKLNYLLRSAANFSNRAALRCPNCDSTSSNPVDRKYLVTELRRCVDCQLMFRTPTDTEEFNRVFYNRHYRQGTTTEMPSSVQLEALKASKFENTEQSYSGYLEFLSRHGVKKGKLFDFGCSWGYGSYQFAQADYDTYSYEIAVDRRTYAIDKLDIRHVDEPMSINDGHPLAGACDCFFSAHVLEHVPSPSKVFDLAWRCLKDGGAFVAFTPNGNAGFRAFNPQAWRNMWGGVHPNYLDDVFYERHFARSKRSFGSRDGSEMNHQYELGFIAFKDASKGGF